MGVSSLQTKIAVRLVLLLLLAMGLMVLVVVFSLERELVRHKAADGRRLLADLAEELTAGGGALPAPYRLGGASGLVRLDPDLIRVRERRGSGYAPEHLDGSRRSELQRNGEAVFFDGSTWGVVGQEPRFLTVFRLLPGDGGGPRRGAVGAVWDLETTYGRLRRLQPAIGAYMLVNLLLLGLLGVFWLGRVTVRPLQRLMRRAESFSEGGDPLFASAPEDHDFARLSKSLNQIVGRMLEDQSALQATVVRLEQANEDLKQAQLEILQAEKLAVVGRLSAGLAHEIGNPLGIVIGYLELLRQDGLPAEERAEIIARTEAELNRIHRILRQLLDFARPAPEKKQRRSVHALLEETTSVFELQPLTAGIVLERHFDADQDDVLTTGEQLRQVFLNIMLNAADAIQAAGAGRQGRLTIGTATTGKDDGPALIRIRFTDNGTGIAAEDLPLIFDPFFSTKQPGQGTGLGLSVSYLTIEASGGRMAAESREGEGTTFTVELPLAPAMESYE